MKFGFKVCLGLRDKYFNVFLNAVFSAPYDAIGQDIISDSV